MIVGEENPRLAGRVNDFVIIVKNSVREPVAVWIFPDAFDRIDSGE
jgi:hypothetical protein